MSSRLRNPLLVMTALGLAACSDKPDPIPQADAEPDAATTPDVRTTPDVGSDHDATAPDVGVDGDVNAPEDARLDRPSRPDGAAFTCDIPRVRTAFSLSATLPDGTTHRCDALPADAAGSLHRTFSGVVRSVTATMPDNYAITIDTCVGDACTPQNVVFAVTSPTALTLPSNAFVETEYWIEQSHECSYALRFSNLPEWNGQKNPVSDVMKLHFFASHGFTDPKTQTAAIGVGVAVLGLGCQPDAGRGGGVFLPPDTYVFLFSHNGNTVTLPTGESMPFVVNNQTLRVTNLRSFQLDDYDNYWNWEFIFDDP
jgi:hypothetical protein